MEIDNDTAQSSSENFVKQTSVKQEPECDYGIGFEEYKVNDLYFGNIKTEPQDAFDTAVCDSEDDQDLPVTFEAGDPEVAGRRVDDGLRERLEEEQQSSPDPIGN